MLALGEGADAELAGGPKSSCGGSSPAGDEGRVDGCCGGADGDVEGAARPGGPIGG